MEFDVRKFRKEFGLKVADVARITGEIRQSVYNSQKTGKVTLKAYNNIETWIESKKRRLDIIADWQIAEFIYFRMIAVHKENENFDYMQRFKKLIDSLK